MPGIERLPMWIRLVLFWTLLSLGLTAIACLVAGEPFTAGRLLFVAVIVAVTQAAELLWRHRRHGAI